MKRGELLAKSVEMMASRPWYKRFWSSWLKLTGREHLEDGWLRQRMDAAILRDRYGDRKDSP